MEHNSYIEMAASEERHWWFRGRRRVLEAAIRRLELPANARILELGSGTGGNFAMLAKFGKVTAVEKNDTARELSAAKPIVQDVRAGSLPDRLPLTDERFDLICLFDVLEHVVQDEATLRVVKLYLAPGGSLILTVPAFRWLWSAHDVALHHKRRYERAELKSRLQAAGYIVTRLSYANMLLFPAALLLRVMDRVLRRTGASGNAIPAFALNEIFAAMFGAERYVPGWMRLPFGLSLLAVARMNIGPGRI